MSTHQKILTLMKGCDSSSPIPFDELVEKSGLQPGTLENVLGAMCRQSPPLINVCTVTRLGIKQDVYWPIGIVDHRRDIPIVINLQNSIANGFSGQRTPLRRLQTPVPESAPEAVEAVEVKTESLPEVQEKTSIQKGVGMNTVSNSGYRAGTSKLRIALYDKIVMHPGISRAALIRHAQQTCPDATEKQIVKTIQNLMHSSKQIRAEGKRDNPCYHLNAGTIQPQSKLTKKNPVPKTPPAKLLMGDEGRIESEKVKTALVRHVKNEIKAPVSSPAKEVPPNDGLGFAFSDDGGMQITQEDQVVSLAPVQVTRLLKFMERVALINL